MMTISGKVVLEDLTITFECVDGLAHFIVDEQEPDGTKRSEKLQRPQAEFLAALAIAVHNDGTPEWENDYPAAERCQGAIRWIP